MLKFLLPSLLGIILFMVPIPSGDSMTILIALLSGWVQQLLADSLPTLMTFIITLTVIGTFFAKLLRPNFIKPTSFFYGLFNVSWFWAITRFLGMIFAIITLTQWGPEWIWSENTGGLLLYDLLSILFSVFLFAGLFLPLLLNFGLLEFFGTLLTKVMRPVFKLPGRSSIDCIASWLGDGTIGVLLTNKQYQQGYYTTREAAVIGTNFSVVSITFSLVVIAQLNLEHMFIPFYLTVVLAGLVAAIICPRIPPLSKKEDSYYAATHQDLGETIPPEFTPLSWGLNLAVKKAATNNSIGQFFKDGAKNVLDMWMGVAPVIMAFGTVALVIAEYTSVFVWLGLPFIPILELLRIPEASAASQTMIVGFADMFLPAVIGSSIESELTRFVIACVSVTQLIYLSEVGGLLLGSKIPVSLGDLFIIFLQRTIITLPLIAIIAHSLF